MTQQSVATGVSHAGDDMVLPFQTAMSGVSGKLVRLGPLVDRILSGHDYPEPVSTVLGQALALTGLLGTALKFNGRFIVQTKTDGPLNFLIADFEAATADQPGGLRGYAAYDAAKTAALTETAPKNQSALLGSGHLAMTIDPGNQMDRYQGIVSLSGDDTLETAALTYFRQSEQLPTFLKLAVARHYSAATKSWHWRAGGLLIQYVSPEGGHERAVPSGEDVDMRLLGEDTDDWQRAVILARTVEDHELLDPMLAPERLLYRLFHEEGVRGHDPIRLAPYCRCSRERVENFLKTFGNAELADMREADGAVAVTCEFCSSTYRFSDDELL